MSTWHTQQAALRDATQAHGLTPWASPDHAADLARVLREMPVSAATVYARNSRGEAWGVTRLGHGLWLAARGARMVRGALAYVVESMEQ